jgi:hypothetical protein
MKMIFGLPAEKQLQHKASNNHVEREQIRRMDNA